MKKIGFLLFGHWTPSPQSLTRSAADTLLQSIDPAVATEAPAVEKAYFRVHPGLTSASVHDSGGIML